MRWKICSHAVRRSLCTFADLTTALDTHLSNASVLGLSAEGAHRASAVLTVSRRVKALHH